MQRLLYLFFFQQNSFAFNYSMLAQKYPIASQAELQLSLDLSFLCKKLNICFFKKS